MPRVTDPALLQQLNGPAPAAAPGIIRAPASPMQDIQQRRGEIGIQADLQGMQNDSVRLSIAQQQASLAQRDQALQEEKAARERAKYAATGGVDTTEAEKTAAFLATRVASGLKTLKSVGSAGDASLANRAAESLPFGIGNYFIGEDRQRTATAQLDVLDAALTLGTGAAYTKEQLEGYRQSYFPQPGDGPDVIADKRSRLNVLLEAAKVKAGAAAPQIDAALNAAGVDNQQEGANPVDVALTGKPKKEADGSISVLQSDGTTSVYPNEHAYQMSQDGTPQITVTDESAAPSPTAQARDSTLGTIDSIVRGAADTLTLSFADEIAAAGDTFFGSGTMRDNLRRQRGIDAIDEQVNPYARLSGQVIGGLALPAGSASGAVGLARVGALYGAGYGAGSAEGGATDRLIGAGKGAVFGGVTGGVLGKVLPTGGGGPRPPDPNRSQALDLIAAAGRQGVDVLPADVGGNFTQRLTSGTAQTTFGGPQIVNASRAQQGQAQAAVARAAGEVTSPTTEFGAGRAAQTGLTKWIKTSEGQSERLYNQISVPSGQPAEIRNTLTALEEVTQGMGSNDALSSIWTGHPRLRQTLEALQRPEVRQIVRQDGGLPGWEKKVGDRWVRLSQREIDGGAAEGGGASWEDMKRLRSIVGEIIGQPSLASEGPENSAMRRLYAGLSEDMRLTAERQGGSALREFERANSFYAARQGRIKNVVEPILGDGAGDGQAAYNRIQNWAKNKGESMRVAQLARSLPPEERETVGATVISQLGKSSSGRQNADSTAFSLSDFLTHWNGLDPSAKQALFTRDQRSALNDMAKIADRTKEAQRFANTSNTAGASNVNATTGGLAAAIPLAFTAGPLAALAAVSPAVGQYVTGRMLASPKMVQWLTRGPKDYSTAVKRLQQIAVREPALAPDISRITQALQASPGRMAASTGEENQ